MSVLKHNFENLNIFKQKFQYMLNMVDANLKIGLNVMFRHAEFALYLLNYEYFENLCCICNCVAFE